MPVRVHARAIACRKAPTSKQGLFAFFQHVSPEPSATYDAMAASFFDGVQFVKK